MLYELLTGRWPFAAKSRAELRDRQWTAPARPSGLVAGLDPLFDRAMAFRPLPPAKDPNWLRGHAADLARTLGGADRSVESSGFEWDFDLVKSGGVAVPPSGWWTVNGPLAPTEPSGNGSAFVTGRGHQASETVLGVTRANGRGTAASLEVEQPGNATLLAGRGPSPAPGSTFF